MATMEEAEQLALTLDAHLVALGDAAYATQTLDAFNDSLYDFRADGDLEAHVQRVQELLAEAVARPAAPNANRRQPPAEGPLARSWRSMFSSG